MAAAIERPKTDLYFYNNRYVDYVIDEMIDKYRDKTWKRSIDLQRKAVNWAPAIASMGINNQYNEQYGFPIINPDPKSRFRAGKPISFMEWMRTVVLTGTINRDILPYYNKKAFLKRYGYNKEIPLKTIMTDTNTFSKRIMCAMFDGWYCFDDISFILRPGDTTIVVAKGEHSAFLAYYYIQHTISFMVMSVDSNAHEWECLRFFFEPISSVYHKTGLANELVSKSDAYPNKPITLISTWEELVHKRKINNNTSYSIYINKKNTKLTEFGIIDPEIVGPIPDNFLLDYFAKNAANGIPGSTDQMIVWDMNDKIDDLMTSMATSTLTDQFEIYIIENYRKIGSVIMDGSSLGITGDPATNPPTLDFIMQIPFKDNVIHPYNIVPYIWRLPAVYSGFGESDLTHKDYGPVTNTPHMYWSYDGLVEKPGATLSPLYNFNLNDYYQKMFLGEMGDNPGVYPTPMGYNPTPYEDISAFNVYGIFYDKGLDHISQNFSSAFTFDPNVVYQFDYYEADPEIVQGRFANPVKRYQNFYREFYANEAVTSGNPIIPWILERPFGSYLSFEYSFYDYAYSEHYGDLRAYKVNKFGELICDNPDILQEYVERVNDIHYEFRPYEVDWSSLLSDGRTPVMDTSTMGGSPEEVIHFDKPQIYIKMTTSMDTPKEIEAFVNGKRTEVTATLNIGGESWVFIDADTVPDDTTIVLDIAKYPDNPTESKHHGQFTINDINTPIPFPSGFGNVSTSDLIFYDAITKEYIDIKDGKLIITDHKDTVEVENEQGDPERVIISDQHDPFIYLRTATGDFYKTSASEKWLLEEAKTAIDIPTQNPFEKPINTENVTISTSDTNLIGKTIAITNTDNHREAKGDLTVSNIITMPKWGESTDSSRFMVHVGGKLLGQNDYTINYPTKYGEDLTITINTPPVEGQDNTILVDYLPYSQKMLYNVGGIVIKELRPLKTTLLDSLIKTLDTRTAVPSSTPWYEDLITRSGDISIARPIDFRYSKVYINGYRVNPSDILRCDGMNTFSIKKYDSIDDVIQIYSPYTDSIEFLTYMTGFVDTVDLLGRSLPYILSIYDEDFATDMVTHGEILSHRLVGSEDKIDIDLTNPSIWVKGSWMNSPDQYGWITEDNNSMSIISPISTKIIKNYSSTDKVRIDVKLPFQAEPYDRTKINWIANDPRIAKMLEDFIPSEAEETNPNFKIRLYVRIISRAGDDMSVGGQYAFSDGIAWPISGSVSLSFSKVYINDSFALFVSLKKEIIPA